MSRLMFCLLFALLMLAPQARAQEGVDVALVLVDDVSGSINDQQFEKQKDGYFAAFTDPKVHAAIQGGALGQILVAYVEFASDFQVRTVLPWTVIKDAASARAFAEAMRAAPRSFRGRTSISAGIDEAMKLMANIPIATDRKVIDVCGDGTNNLGRPVSEARDDAAKQGVVINGLALANDSDVPWLYAHTHPPGGLGNYYRENVTIGPGNFVIEINSFESFAEAIKRKLIQEIS
ncbi:MAG: DUF1194 domain-containing protein [Acetobacteraceae bacterium]|nr:DUF1194 domain-containing protein [Acetobacteraceae bacterium]